MTCDSGSLDGVVSCYGSACCILGDSLIVRADLKVLITRWGRVIILVVRASLSITPSSLVF